MKRSRSPSSCASSTAFDSDTSIEGEEISSTNNAKESSAVVASSSPLRKRQKRANPSSKKETPPIHLSFKRACLLNLTKLAARFFPLVSPETRVKGLVIAIQQHHNSLAKELLKNRRHWTVSERDELLHAATSADNTALALALLDQNAWHWSVVCTAAARGNLPILQRAWDDRPTHCRVDNGLCDKAIPLLLAAKHGNADIVKFLLTRTTWSHSILAEAYEIAVQKGFANTAHILLAHVSWHTDTFDNLSNSHALELFIACAGQQKRLEVYYQHENETYTDDITKILNNYENCPDSLCVCNTIGTAATYTTKHTELVERLLELDRRRQHKCFLCARKSDKNHARRLAIHVAAAQNNNPLVRLILSDIQQDKQDTNKKSIEPESVYLTPILVALAKATQHNHLDLVQMLVEEYHANISADDDYALRLAAECGHVLICAYLLEKGANLHACDDLPLVEAARNNHAECVEFLLRHGAKAQTKYCPALENAVKHKNVPMARLLLEHGALPSSQDDEIFLTALPFLPMVQVLFELGNGTSLVQNKRFFLNQAVKENHVHIVAYLLRVWKANLFFSSMSFSGRACTYQRMQQGVDDDDDDDGMDKEDGMFDDALFLASVHGHKQLVCLLASHGAVNRLNDALMRAIETQRRNMAEFLLTGKAGVVADIHAFEDIALSVFCDSCFSAKENTWKVDIDNIEMARLLLRSGANLLAHDAPLIALASWCKDDKLDACLRDFLPLFSRNLDESSTTGNTVTTGSEQNNMIDKPQNTETAVYKYEWKRPVVSIEEKTAFYHRLSNL